MNSSRSQIYAFLDWYLRGHERKLSLFSQSGAFVRLRNCFALRVRHTCTRCSYLEGVVDIIIIFDFLILWRWRLSWIPPTLVYLVIDLWIGYRRCTFVYRRWQPTKLRAKVEEVHEEKTKWQSERVKGKKSRSIAMVNQFCCAFSGMCAHSPVTNLASKYAQPSQTAVHLKMRSCTSRRVK